MLSPRISWGATYYVSTTGNDSNSGTSESSPWKTISKINSSSFQPGDSILFKRGEVWREQLVVPSSGSSGKPITFGAYGSGEKPKILGSVNLSSSSNWQTYTSNTVTLGGLTGGTQWDNADRIWGGVESTYNNLGNNGDSIFGMRFLGVTVPAGSTITAATVGFHSNNNLAGTTVNLKIDGERNTTPTIFLTLSDFNARIHTTASTVWNNVGAWSGGNWYTSPDISSVIQEIVNLNGWSTGNSLVLFVRDNGSTAGAVRQSNMMYDNAGVAPQLSITYRGASLPNIWKTPSALTAKDVGNIIFNGELSIGRKKSSIGSLAAQGDFYYDPTGKYLYVFSISNPGTYYSSIEAAQYILYVNQAQITAKSYVTIQDLDFRYGGHHGIFFDGYESYNNSDNIIIQRNDFSYIGGAYESGTKRGGNGIEIYSQASNVTVRYNTFNQIYDCAMAAENGESNRAFSNLNFYYNLVTNSENGFALLMMGANTTISNVHFSNNVIYNNGGGWSHPQRPDPLGTAFLFFGSNANTSNVYIENNIVHTSTQWHVYLYSTYKDFANFVWDYNLYYPDFATAFSYYGTTYNFAGWKSATGKDANSIISDPLFVNAAGNNFHLMSNSPAINKGVNVGLTRDFDGVTVPQGFAYDIGAYEYVGAVPPDTTPPAAPTGVTVN